MEPHEEQPSPDDVAESFSTPSLSTTAGQIPVRKEREIRNLVLDYAIGVSLLGLIPVRGWLMVKLLVAAGLILKMMRDVGARWGFPGGQDPLALAGNIFGGLGAFAIALMAWATLLTLGLFVPYVGRFAIAAALFTLTWTLGQVTNQFYASGRRP